MDICSELPGDETSQKVTDETEDGFASIAKQKLEEDYIPPIGAVEEVEEPELDGEMILTKV